MRLVISFADRHKLNCIYPIHARRCGPILLYSRFLHIYIYIYIAAGVYNAQNLRCEWSTAANGNLIFLLFPSHNRCDCAAVTVSPCVRLAADDARSNNNKIETNNTYLMGYTAISATWHKTKSGKVNDDDLFELVEFSQRPRDAKYYYSYTK